jgi:hypothetical protein
MSWAHWAGGFFSGAILANAVPHFVQGISGNRFPTPFAKPPGKGLSSPRVNVIWALFNMVIGAAIFQWSHVSGHNIADMGIFFAGITAIAILSSTHFAQKHKE